MADVIAFPDRGGHAAALPGPGPLPLLVGDRVRIVVLRQVGYVQEVQQRHDGPRFLVAGPVARGWWCRGELAVEPLDPPRGRAGR